MHRFDESTKEQEGIIVKLSVSLTSNLPDSTADAKLHARTTARQLAYKASESCFTQNLLQRIVTHQSSLIDNRVELDESVREDILMNFIGVDIEIGSSVVYSDSILANCDGAKSDHDAAKLKENALSLKSTRKSGRLYDQRYEKWVEDISECASVDVEHTFIRSSGSLLVPQLVSYVKDALKVTILCKNK